MSKYVNYADPQTCCGAAISQMEEAMKCDFVVRGALMPDTHKGYALPIGAVVETKDAVVPSWVGYDIGCGVSCSILDMPLSDIEGKEEEILEATKRYIPVGNNRHPNSTPNDVFEMKAYSQLSVAGKAVYDKRADKQLGTLGGGNHFLEIGVTDHGKVAIIVHSGSRGLGHGIATHYMKMAAEENGITKGNQEGNYPLRKIESVNSYINDALIAQDYALKNREKMTEACLNAISSVILKPSPPVLEFINRNHNHVEVKEDNHYIHRKGATHAEKGMLGVIPGNMRDGCFIVEGRGLDSWINSSSHGAGRVLSRSQAKKEITLEQYQEATKGITGCIKESTIDEAPMAYKDIFQVMNLQKDSVNILHHVRPVINLKG